MLCLNSDRANSNGRPEKKKARHRRKKLPKGGVKEGGRARGYLGAFSISD